MVGLFNNKNTFQLPLLIIVAVAARVPFLGMAVPVPEKLAGGFLEPWFYQKLVPAFSAFALNLLALLWTLACIFLASFVATQARLFSKSGLLPALCMFLLLIMHPAVAAPSPALLMLPLYLLFFLNSIGLYATYKPVAAVVNAGLIAGVGFLLYHSFAWLALSGLVMLGQLRAFRIKEWLQYVAALFIPIYIVLSLMYINDNWQPRLLLPQWGIAGVQQNWNGYWWLFAGFYVLLGLIALNSWRRNLNRMLIQSRKNWYVLLLGGLLWLPSAFWPQHHFMASLVFISFPAGMYISNIFFGENAFWKTLLFWLWVLVIAVLSWAHLMQKI